MSEWIALSDSDELAPAGPSALHSGAFVLEFLLPLTDPTVLLQGMGERGLAVSIFFDPIVGISLLQRDAHQVRRHLLPGPIFSRPGPARLTFAFDAPGRVWTLTFQILDDDLRHSSSGLDPLPLPVAEIRGLFSAAGGTLRHPAVLWFGVTQRAALPARAPWMGLNTPIATRRGTIRAGSLRPGDMIATLEDGFQPLIGLHRRTYPSRGSFAPVLLRSPFFGLTSDILVSSDQLVLISGASVEYLYGVDEALISAASLCDNHVAGKDERRPVTDAVTLDLGAPFAIIADGCCLMPAYSAVDVLPRRVLRDYEALPLQALLGRTALRHVA
jgi:hypothetical protein